ncbi:MAG: hypothetical protein H7A33_05675 [Deltaproteobacteria bacterium]|nr:hypothetical protein [Deltaproteobacteria bacterium]
MLDSAIQNLIAQSQNQKHFQLIQSFQSNKSCRVFGRALARSLARKNNDVLVISLVDQRPKKSALENLFQDIYGPEISEQLLSFRALPDILSLIALKEESGTLVLNKKEGAPLELVFVKGELHDQQNPVRFSNAKEILKSQLFHKVFRQRFLSLQFKKQKFKKQSLKDLQAIITAKELLQRVELTANSLMVMRFNKHLEERDGYKELAHNQDKSLTLLQIKNLVKIMPLLKAEHESILLLVPSDISSKAWLSLSQSVDAVVQIADLKKDKALLKRYGKHARALEKNQFIVESL